MRNLVLNEEWEEIETLLSRARIPYRVAFDNHSGLVRKIVEIEPISIMCYKQKEEVDGGN